MLNSRVLIGRSQRAGNGAGYRTIERFERRAEGMSAVTDYLSGLHGINREVIRDVITTARHAAPMHTEDVSYGMPCLMYRGKGLISVLETKNHLALYPYSGQVLPKLSEALGEFDWSVGTLRFQASNRPSGDLVRNIVNLRIAEIDAKLDAPK